MEVIIDALKSISNVFQSIRTIDILDIALLTYLIYKAMKLVRETRAGQLLKGIILLVIAYLIANILGLKSIKFLMEKTFDIGLIAVLIMFQPELRRALEKVGRTKVSKIGMFSIGSEISDDLIQKWTVAIDAICETCEDFSESRTGALFVIERETRLGEQIDTGTIIDAVPSVELFGNIFYNKTPLHDGAVIIRDGIIHAAACFLPKPQKEELINKQLGSRHRAAIGMSEVSDAIVIAVSEETGAISIAENGDLSRGFTKDSLRKLLKVRLIPEKPVVNREKKNYFRRKKRDELE